MEKKVLEQYIDACELIKETEKDIRRLKKKRQTIVQTNVSGSNPDLPHTMITNHNGGFDVDENALVTGAGLYVGYTVARLG